MESDYPVRFGVEYPDRLLNRVSTGFRIFAAIPILILLATIGERFGGFGAPERWGPAAGGAGLLFLPVLLMLLFRQKYPRWWFDWNLELLRFMNRIAVYLALMDDRYPSTDEPQSVGLDLPYPGSPATVSRGLPLVKWFLAIPHYIVLIALYVAAIVLVVIAWFAILFTGRYPRGMFDFVEGVLRWHNRVVAYAFVLVTDQYPPFRLSP
jgi:Domain of unknown function (DUF4389)